MAAAKVRLNIQNEFPAVKRAAWDLVSEARDQWIRTGQSEGEATAAAKAATRGYALQVGIAGEKLGHQSARIIPTTHTSKWGDDPFFLRFFEYGTVYIPAMPFLRPAARKANKQFVNTLGDQLEGRIRRKVRTRRR